MVVLGGERSILVLLVASYFFLDGILSYKLTVITLLSYIYIECVYKRERIRGRDCVVCVYERVRPLCSDVGGSGLPPLVMRGYPTELGACPSGLAFSQGCLSPSPRAGFQVQEDMPGFLHGCRDSNPGLQVIVLAQGALLHTEPSPQP